MSTLQISLAVLGLVLLGLVFAYNVWTYRRHAPRRAQQARPAAPARRSEPDLLGSAAGDGVELPTAAPPVPVGAEDDPVLHARPLAEAPEELAAAAETVEPGLKADAAGPHAQQRPVERHIERRVALDALIDALAVVQLEQPTAGEAILQVQPTTRRAGSKPFQVEGRNASTGQWEPVRAGQRYSQLQAGVQLANRMGPLN